MNPLDLLEAPLRAVLDFFHSVGFTWGWAIVMLTLVVRLILLPLFVKQYKSARRMQEVAPQMKEMQRKYKGNKQKLQEEMMKFYKENDVNPFGSCLPLLLQAPVFIALYYTLRSQDFADGTDLSFMYVVPDVSKLLTEIGWAVVPLILVYAVSQLISTELSATATMSRNQRWLMRLLPIGIVFFIFQFPVPAGLVIYWATTNLWTAGQQLVLKRRIEAEIEAKGGTLLGAVPAKAGSTDEADAEGDGEGDAPAPPAGEAVSTEDVEVRTKPLPRRRKGRKAEAAEAGSDAPAEGPPQPAAAQQPEGGASGDGAEGAQDDAPPAPAGGSASGKKKRKPPTRKKVSGGPSRPARRKPPKRRK
jgi:YidC/Oxa1 family membrane protein insertase